MNISEYKNQLRAALSEDKGCVVLINGQWGAGKTHFWNDYAEHELSDKAACVSLFGKHSINDIQSEALIQIFSRNKIIDYISKAGESIKTALTLGDKDKGGLNLGIAGNSLGLLLSLAKAKSLKNNYVCLDDFERKSNKLGIDEIMGYASILSERYACKVILIMNEEEVTKSSESDIYSRYKEKTINYEILFRPDHSNTVGIFLESLNKKYKKGVAEAIDFAKIHNLRTVLKTIQRLNHLDKVVTIDFCETSLDLLSFNFALVSLVYFELGREGLENISKMQADRMIRSINKNKNGEIEPLKDEKKLSYYESRIQYRVSINSQLDILLFNFLDTLSIDIKKLKELLDDEEVANELKDNRDYVYGILKKYTYDLSYDDSNFVDDMTSILKKNVDKILLFLNLDSFLHIIDTLSEVSGNDEEYLKLKQEVLLAFVNDKLAKATTLHDLNELKKNELILAISEKDEVSNSLLESHFNSNKLITVNSIKTILDNLVKERGWNAENKYAINSVSVDFLKDGILQNQGFLESIVEFLKWATRFSEPSPFKEICEKSHMALKDLGVERLGAVRFKWIMKVFDMQS